MGYGIARDVTSSKTAAKIEFGAHDMRILFHTFYSNLGQAKKYCLLYLRVYKLLGFIVLGFQCMALLMQQRFKKTIYVCVTDQA